MNIYKGIALEPIDENQPLMAGDRVVIRYKWLVENLYLRAMQWDIANKKLEARKDFCVLSFADSPEFLDVEIEVLISSQAKPVDPGSGMTQASFVISTGLVISIAFISSAIIATFHWLEKREQYKLVWAGKTPPGSSSPLKEISAGLHVGIYVAVAIGLIWILKRISGNSKGYSSSGRNGYS